MKINTVLVASGGWFSNEWEMWCHFADRCAYYKCNANFFVQTCDPFEDWAILKSKHSVFLCTFQTKTLSACSVYVACAQAFHISRWHFCRSTGVMFWHGNVWHKAILSTEIHQTLFTSLGHFKYFNFVTF